MNFLPKIIFQSRWLGLVLIAIVTLCLYAVMLKAPFRGMDDSTTIVHNDDIRSFNNIPRIFTSSFFGDRSYYRPLVTFSYMLEYHCAGLRSFVYNLDNVFVHVLNAWALFFLILRLTGDRSTAWWTSFLFAVHPVQWEAVANVSGRVILLAALFSFLSFGWFIDFDRRRRIICLAGSLLSFTLALLCKESSAMLPVVLTAYLLVVPREGRRRPWPALFVFGLIVAGIIILRRQLGITELFGWGSWQATGLGFLTFVSGVATYLRLLILPVDLYFDRSQPVFQSLSDPAVWATMVFWSGILWMVWRWRRRIDPVSAFLMLWFALELAPVSQIVTSLGVQPGFISLAEHFLYVPSAAFWAAVVIGLRRLWTVDVVRRWCSPRTASWALAGFVVFLGLTTVQQNLYASNELAMLRRSLAFQPYNSRVRYSMGMYYVDRGLFAQAQEYFQHAVAIDPWNVRARIALGKVLCDQGRYREGLAVYQSIQNADALQDLLQENIRLTKAMIGVM